MIAAANRVRVKRVMILSFSVSVGVKGDLLSNMPSGNSRHVLPVSKILFFAPDRVRPRLVKSRRGLHGGSSLGLSLPNAGSRFLGDERGELNWPAV